MSGQTIIVDYGVGNLFNVQHALERNGCAARVSHDPAAVAAAARVVLPGVGAFEAGMQHLRDYGLLAVVTALAREGRPILGICLGMQLLMSRSVENGLHEGLNLVPGSVRRLGDGAGPFRTRVPQLGWNRLRAMTASSNGCDPLLEGLGEAPFMYFAHSYYPDPDDRGAFVAVTDYGADVFCSVLRSGNIVGCQFHPERSGEAGLRFLRNFAAMDQR